MIRALPAALLVLGLAPASSEAQCERQRVRFGPNRYAGAVLLSHHGDRAFVRENFTPYDVVAVYEYDGVTWERTQDLKGDQGLLWGVYAKSMDVSGDGRTLCVQQSENWDGEVIVYDLEGSTWVETDRFSPAGSDRDDFGGDVAISYDGNRIVAACQYYSTIPTYPFLFGEGAVFVYDRGEDGSWKQHRMIRGPEGFGSDYGQSVDISADGNCIAVGSYLYDHYDIGVIHVFEYVDDEWKVHELRHTAAHGLFDWNGYDVQLSGDGRRVMAGVTSLGEGFVTVFEREEGGWVEGPQLRLSDRFPGDGLGRVNALSSDGTVALFGVKGQETRFRGDGAVYVYRRGADGWQEEKIGASDAFPGAGFGGTVAISGDGTRALVTADRDEDRDTVYFLDLAMCGTPLELPSAPGEEQELVLRAGPANAHQLYVVLGSTTGAYPGVRLGRGRLLPLVPDAYTWMTRTPGAHVPLTGGFGFLDENGEARVTFTVPASPVLPPDTTFIHSAVALDVHSRRIRWISNPVPVSVGASRAAGSRPKVSPAGRPVR